MNGYDDDLSETEQAELRNLEERDRALTTTVDDKLPGVPEADSDAGNADLIAEAEAQDAAKKTPPAAPADPTAPPADPAVPPADTPPADETLGQFMARHRAAGKTDDEIAGLVENRGKRAAREGFQRRKGRTPEQIAADRRALADRSTKLKSTDFDAKLAEDPDAAAKLLHQSQVERDQAEIDRQAAALDAEEHSALIDDALEFAHRHIEDLPEAYPKMLQFGQAIGYKPDELDAITDGRDLLTLNLARIAGDLILSKVIDKRGNLLPQVQPTTDTPRDPRLTPPRAPAGHTAPQNANAPVASLETQAASALTMSDDEFDKLPPETLARMMGGR